MDFDNFQSVCLYYKLPVLTKQVCYTFPNGNEICVNGDNYEIKYGGWTTTENPIASFSPKGYCTHWKREWWTLSGGTFFIRETDYDNRFNEFAPSNVENNPDTDFTFTADFTVNNSASCGQTLTYYNQLKDGVMFAPSEWGYSSSVPTLKFYPTKINIKNNNGQVIKIIQGDGTPTIRVINSNVCNYSNVPWVLGSKIAVTPNDSILTKKLIANGKKCTQVFLMVNNRVGFSGVDAPKLQLLFYRCSDCGYPEIKLTDCTEKGEKPPKKKVENCPPNTCYECTEGNIKCCYDSKLKLIKTIKL
jgi:hypothetical protein